MSDVLVVTSEFRFKVFKDGTVWTDSQYANEFWLRYLSVFSRVEIVARGLEVSALEESWMRVDCARVKLITIPHYIGPFGFLKNLLGIRRVMKTVSEKDASFILRVPGMMATMLARELKLSSKNYAVEVVGDPADVFSKDTSSHPLRIFFRWYFSSRLKKQVNGACAAAYVTKSRLQSRYPAKKSSYTSYFSSIELPDAFFEFPIKSEFGSPCNILFIGSLAQRYKGLHVLLDALIRYQKQGGRFSLVVVGDGREKESYERYARSLGFTNEVSFFGAVASMEDIGQQFRGADIFVLPSLTEGLPRVVIEAMACGVPCIATNVGGTPELLPDTCLVSSNDSGELSDKIHEFVSDPTHALLQARANRINAAEFKSAILQARRNTFYYFVKSSLSDK